MQNTNLISAEVVADSLNQYGEGLTTLKLVFPRYILAELNTHRLFSKNSASSRAIPFKKMVAQVMETPFIPMAWQKDHKGMQGSEYHTTGIGDIEDTWLRARDKAVEEATILNQRGVTKQLCNRLLEPYLYHTVLLTASHFQNFFKLRCPQYENNAGITWRSKRDFTFENSIADNFGLKDWLKRNKGQADIHIMDLAEKMWDAMRVSKPEQLEAGDWHIPYGDQINDRQLEDVLNNINYCPSPVLNNINFNLQARLAIATARCARISYQTLGDNPVIDYAKDIKLFDDLLVSGHWSPFEHCAMVMRKHDYYSHVKGIMALDYMSIDDEYAYTYKNVSSDVFGWSRNFKGFKQYRELLDEEGRSEQTS